MYDVVRPSYDRSVSSTGCPRGHSGSCVARGLVSGPQQYLDRSALVHGPVALDGLVEWQCQVEDIARVDRAVPDPASRLQSPQHSELLITSLRSVLFTPKVCGASHKTVW
jgi:hypothetical protein